MKILGIDTSSRFLSIALHESARIKGRLTANIHGTPCLIKEENYLLDRRHSSLLIPNIKDMLEEIGLSIRDIDVFVIGLGPGSFTGLRIGVSTVKGFGIALKKTCIGIASIDSIALNADGRSGTIVPIIDAKRRNVYSAIYKKEEDCIVRKSDYILSGIDGLIKKVNGNAVFLGDGVSLYKERIRSVNKKAVFLEEEHWYPHAGNLIRLALPKIKGPKKYSLNKLKPIYLYPRDCQVTNK